MSLSRVPITLIFLIFISETHRSFVKGAEPEPKTEQKLEEKIDVDPLEDEYGEVVFASMVNGIVIFFYHLRRMERSIFVRLTRKVNAQISK